MSNKKYYWLKLNKDFFEEDTIQWIEEQENGKDYIIFYLKLALKSLEDDGYLIRYVGEKLIPYDVNALARLTNTPIDTVAVAMKVFEDIGLISRLDSGEIYMNQIDEMIGSETESAKRVRKHRARKQALQSNDKALQSNSDVIKSNTEKEIEKEIDIEIEVEVEAEETTTSTNKGLTKNDRDLIMQTWNNLGLNYLVSINPNTKRYDMLRARINEYGLDEVLKAIKSISNSPFLKGQNKKSWIVTFDWFVRPNNFIKVLEGNYIDEVQNGANNKQARNEDKIDWAERAGVLRL